MELAETVYQLSRQFPKNETNGLSGHIQEAVISIPASVAEGDARGSTKDLLRHLAIAQGSLAELQPHLLLAKHLNYCEEAQMSQIFGKCTQGAKTLRNLRKRLRSRLQT